MANRDIPCDILVVGGSLGGVAAALSAAKRGATVCLLASSSWLGGQLTSQGVCTPDDTLAVETVGSTLSYRTMRDATRTYYRTHHRLSELGKAQDPLIPGNCWVGYLSVEPRVADAILKSTLAEVPSLTIFYHTVALRAEIRNDMIHRVTALSNGQQAVHFIPKMVLDATDLGDMLPLTGAEFVTGAESQEHTGEPDASPEAHPEYIQPFTFPFVLERRPRGENYTILPPYDYAELRETEHYHLLDGAMTGMDAGKYPWWTYRRVLAAANFEDVPYDISVINTNSIDYKDALLPGATEDALHRARRAALGYIYWLQTECPREDDPTARGYPEFRILKDFFSTYDGIAPDPYIRESRRIRALHTVVQQDVAEKFQSGPRARPMPTSCGIGDFFMDVHPGERDPERFFLTKPYQIPVDALVPVRIRNLVAACKNIGTTHLTNGCYRVHSVEWNVGESAGLLAAFCIEHDLEPSVMHDNLGRLRTFQAQCVQAGIPIFWWSDISYGHAAWEAVQMLGVTGLFATADDLRFRPEEPVSAPEVEAVQAQTGHAIQTWEGMTRAQYATSIYQAMHRTTPAA